jgi:hypothetical protein
MFTKFATHFFSPKKSVQAKAPRQWLEDQLLSSGLAQKFTPEQQRQTQETVKVFYLQRYYSEGDVATPFSLLRSLTKIPAINVSGDQEGLFQDGTPFPRNSRDFFSNIQTNDQNFLSVDERLHAAKKILYSHSTVFTSGGYPITNPKKVLEHPHKVGIFSLAGSSFENCYLHYPLFILDPINHTIKNEAFAHWYTDLPTNFRQAQSLIKDHPSLIRIPTGFSWLTRTSPNSFSSSYSDKNAVIFLKEAFFKHQLEDVSMLLTAVNNTALENGKSALLKATAVGMGFFAKINGQYDLNHILYPNYLYAFKQLLSEHSYPGIKKIEFPIFSELHKELFNMVMQDYSGDIEVYQASRDVLEFSTEEIERLFVCSVNPSDAFAYSGNEWGNGSVEAMIGNNSSLRFDQVYWLNPLILDPKHHNAMEIIDNFKAEVIDSKLPPTLRF